MNLPPHTLSDEERSPILNITFNNNSNRFATATTEGWVVYSTQPLSIISKREFLNSSLKIVLPLALTNLIFLVGGPPSPLYSPNKVLIWDDKLGKTIVELEFREEVKGLAARQDRLVVVLNNRVIVFVLGKGNLGVWREGVYDTTDNPTGLVALATDEGSSLLAFPGRQAGQIQLVRLPPLDSTTPPLPPSPSHDPTKTPYPSVSIILAHESALSALSTTPSGLVLASASSKGTLVRVWDPTTSQIIKELRRGTDSAEIFGIAIRKDGGAICVSSDKGTVHVWNLDKTKEDKINTSQDDSDSRQRQFNILKPYLPKYFSSNWSHSQFRLPPPAPTASRLPFSLSNPGEGGRSTPTIEDDICVCAWIEFDQEVEVDNHSSKRNESRESRKGKEREHSLPSQNRMEKENSSKSSINRSGLPYETETLSSFKKRKEFQIVALTHSGGWFRISLASSSTDSSFKSETLNVPSFGLGKDSTSDCRLEEYRRFGTKDGW